MNSRTLHVPNKWSYGLYTNSITKNPICGPMVLWAILHIFLKMYYGDKPLLHNCFSTNKLVENPFDEFSVKLIEVNKYSCSICVVMCYILHKLLEINIKYENYNLIDETEKYMDLTSYNDIETISSKLKSISKTVIAQHKKEFRIHLGIIKKMLDESDNKDIEFHDNKIHLTFDDCEDIYDKKTPTTLYSTKQLIEWSHGRKLMKLSSIINT